ncbi:MAG: Sec-independent protein translocase protein TatB [Proteobacteria bacterium]|jgi:sec-independent protein translocase protein TatB|nr:Sec-independent protein translocase protein TatB [Pseudomonadota bacterium]MDA0926525.1 Sec-independent protein translocase protein TatB [Pseudomonadota bacterium]
MFNIGTFELLLICVIALLVLGPERLPGAVRTAGLWIGRFRRSFYKVKADIERELNADEIRRQLHNESIMAELEETKSEVESVAKDTHDSINKIVNSKNFDPGASKYTDEQLQASNAESEAARESSTAKSLKEEIEDDIQQAAEQIDEVKQSLYGTGKNPKLAKAVDNDSSNDEAS